jgi:hypothetical protein
MLKIKHKDMKNNYLKNILNILTEAYDYVKLTEAVPYSVAKEYMTIERSPEAETRIKQVFSKLKSLPNARQLDKRGWRIAFPYAEDSTEFEIQSILEPYDFSIKDYKDGVALDTKSNKEIAIGKALNKISKKEPDAKELLDRYAAIKGKGATNKDEDLMIIFSSAKYDIIGMSTDRDSYWDSCMNVIRGGNRHYVKLDIKEGSIICYLTTLSDTNLKKPLGRVLIKPYINTENKEDVVLYPELKTYGSIPNPQKFMDEVDDYMQKTQKLSGSYERLGCLYKDSDRGEIEDKESVRTRALQKLQDIEGLSRVEFISLPLKNKRQYIDILVKKESRLYDFQYNFASQSQKKEYIKMLFSRKIRVSEFEFKGAPKDIRTEIISKHMEYKIPLEDYELEAATPKQKEEYVDWRLDNNFELGYYEFKAATEQQKTKYISSKIDKYSVLQNYEFEEATQEQKEKYIDSRVGSYKLRQFEFEAATQKQKDEYIDWRIEREDFISDYEFEGASQKQKEDYIDWILNRGYYMRDLYFKAATQKQKEEYIDWKIKNDKSIEKYEFEEATQEQKEKRIDKLLKAYWKFFQDYELEAATPEQKERYKEYAKD